MSDTAKVEPGKTYAVEIEGTRFEGTVLRASQDVPSGWLIETKSGERLIVPESVFVLSSGQAASWFDRSFTFC